MVNYYYIKIAKNDNTFNEQLQYTLNTQSIGIGFEYKQEILNINNLNVNDNSKRMYNKFINEINIGDVVFLCKGENTILYIATIDSEYYFDNNNIINGQLQLPHRRKLSNIVKFNSIAPKRMIQTIYNVRNF